MKKIIYAIRFYNETKWHLLEYIAPASIKETDFLRGLFEDDQRIEKVRILEVIPYEN